jgi:flagellar L-ring protein precursor FlgH
MNETLKFAVTVAALAAVALTSTGCASFGRTLKGLISGQEDGQQVRKVTTPRFSEQENLRVQQEPRQYKRMNRERFEEEAEVGASAGSLWVMEGQGAYLFSQNQMRTVGDLLNVKIEGGPKQQLQTKVRVITRLLERLDNPRGLASVQAAGGEPGQVASAGAPKGQAPNAGGAGAGGDEKSQSEGGAAAASKEQSFAVQSVPTRIIEQLRDGSYRVRGMQPFMIGKREYKVIVTGIVRPEDFDDSGLDSSKLLDSQFDIVSSRKGASL